MIRIAYIVGQLTHGGSERQIYELVIRLDKDHFEPLVICLSEAKEPYGHMIEDFGIKIYYLQNTSHHEFNRVLLISKILRNENIDIVHSYLHVGNGYGVLGALLGGKRCFIPSIRSEEKERPLVMRITDWLGMKYAKIIIVNSIHGKRFVEQQWRVAKDKVNVIHNGIDVNRFALPKNCDFKRDQRSSIIITMIAKHTHVKNVEMFFKVASNIHRERSNTSFWLVGPGFNFDVFADIAAVREGYVKPVGPQNNVEAILSDSDILVLTSRSEGLPNVIMEAMAAGLPLVSTNVGGISEIVMDGETGFLVPSEDCIGMTQKLLQLIDNEKLRIRFGKKAKDIIRSYFSIEEMVLKTKKVYSEII